MSNAIVSTNISEGGIRFCFTENSNHFSHVLTSQTIFHLIASKGKSKNAAYKELAYFTFSYVNSGHDHVS